MFNSIYEAFQTLQVSQSELASKMVAIIADNVSLHGFKQKFRGELPHLIDMSCLSYRLELAVNDSIKDVMFVSMVLDIMELICNFSPKSKRELKELRS